MSSLPATERQRAGADTGIVIRNSAVQVLRYAALWAANVALVLFLPRYLGDEGLGQLQFAISFVSLFAFIVAWGVRHYLVKEVARAHARLPELLGAALGLRALMAVVAFALLAAAVELLGSEGTVRHVVYLAMVWMVITSFAQLLAGTLHGLERMGWESLSEVVSKVLVVVVGVSLLLNGGGVTTYVTVMVLGAAVHLLVNAGVVSRYAPLRVDFQQSRLKELMVGGGPYVFMGFLLGAYMHIDVVMLQAFAEDAVVGWHAAALRIAKAVEFLPMVLATAALPTLARLHPHDVETVGVLARGVVHVTLLVMAPLAIGLSLVSAELIDFFPYPGEFENSVPVLTVMALTALVTASLTVLGTIAIATDRQKSWAVALTVTVALNVVLNLVLIPHTQSAYGNGAIGAAIATLITELFMVGVGVALLPHVVFHRGLLITLGKTAIAVVAMVATVSGAKALGLDLWALVGVGAATYVPAVIALRLVNESDARSLLRAVRYRAAADPSLDPKEPQP